MFHVMNSIHFYIIIIPVIIIILRKSHALVASVLHSSRSYAKFLISLKLLTFYFMFCFVTERYCRLYFTILPSIIALTISWLHNKYPNVFSIILLLLNLFLSQPFSSYPSWLLPRSHLFSPCASTFLFETSLISLCAYFSGF